MTQERRKKYYRLFLCLFNRVFICTMLYLAHLCSSHRFYSCYSHRLWSNSSLTTLFILSHSLPLSACRRFRSNVWSKCRVSYDIDKATKHAFRTKQACEDAEADRRSTIKTCAITIVGVWKFVCVCLWVVGAEENMPLRFTLVMGFWCCCFVVRPLSLPAHSGWMNDHFDWRMDSRCLLVFMDGTICLTLRIEKKMILARNRGRTQLC